MKNKTQNNEYEKNDRLKHVEGKWKKNHCKEWEKKKNNKRENVVKRRGGEITPHSRANKQTPSKKNKKKKNKNKKKKNKQCERLRKMLVNNWKEKSQKNIKCS